MSTHYQIKTILFENRADFIGFVLEIIPYLRIMCFR